MDAKLTIKLEETLVKKAKRYAQEHQTSVSRLVGKFFSTLGTQGNSKKEVDPIVRELSGIIEGKSRINVKEYKKSRLIQKYL